MYTLTCRFGAWERTNACQVVFDVSNLISSSHFDSLSERELKDVRKRPQGATGAAGESGTGCVE